MIFGVSKMALERYVSTSSSERLLAVVIASFAGPDGASIYPSIDTLAKMTGLSRSTVRRLIAEMVRSGWLVLVRKGTGRSQTNEYRIDPTWIAAGQAKAVRVNVSTSNSSYPQAGRRDPFCRSEKGVIRDTKGVNPDIKGVIAVTPDLKEPLRTITPLPPGGGSGGFEHVFAVFPNKTNGSKARFRWNRLAPDAELQQAMLKAIAAQSRTKKWSKDEGRFVPEFANWLRHRGWLDQVDNIPSDWRANFEGVKAMGKQLGKEYSRAGLGNAWTSDEEVAHDRAYQAQVFQLAGEGIWSEDRQLSPTTKRQGPSIVDFEHALLSREPIE